MASVRLDAVTKCFPDGSRAVDALSLDVDDGEFTVLVGPSGCGKTTALRMVAGLEQVTDGAILIGSEVVNDWEPRRRDVAMVFQNYALYPNMTVRQNIEFGLVMRKVERDERRRRVAEIAGILGLEKMLDRKPGGLSGGQRQRVAMGRAVVRSPQVFLMDEPLSNLDAKLRVQMRAEIARIQQEFGTTTLYVTHDQVEAMTMGSRVAVMRKGVLQQYGTPRSIYDAPANLFVASFIGSPAMNLFRARLAGSEAAPQIEFGHQTIALPHLSPVTLRRLAPHWGTTLAVGVRPEALLSHSADQDDFSMQVRVTLAEQLGSEIIVHGSLDALPVATSEIREVAADIDASLAQDVERAASQRETTVLARFGSREQLHVGDVIKVFVDRAALHFFDLETQEAIATTIPGVDDSRNA